jgi:DNA-binding transcriptional MerR regulator
VNETRTIGEVARLAHVSVRTLRHYDAVGLLRPSARSAAGYRLYDRADLERLQQVLGYRELGFRLTDIRRVMNDPAFDRRRALEEQRDLLAARGRRLDALRAAVERSLQAIEKGTTMTADDMFEVFGDFDPWDHEAEVRERWGDSDAYAETARRTAAYAKEDWRAIQAEADEITADFVAALDDRLEPDDAAVQAIVERHWRHLERWFYTPTAAILAGLGDLYVSDPRFTRTIDAARPGLAAYRRAAMRQYAARRGV